MNNLTKEQDEYKQELVRFSKEFNLPQRSVENILDNSLKAQEEVLALADKNGLSEQWKEDAVNILKNNASLQIDIMLFTESNNKEVH